MGHTVDEEVVMLIEEIKRLGKENPGIYIYIYIGGI